MKDYNDYIDNISVDEELHRKIMDKIMQNKKPTKRNKAVLGFSAVASAAVLVFGVFVLFGMLNQQYIPDNNIDGNIPPQHANIQSLTFNTISHISEMSMDRHAIAGPNIAGHEDFADKLQAVFPGLNLHFNSVVPLFAYDGSLLEVDARMIVNTEQQANRNVSVRLSEQELVHTMIVMHDNPPQISYIHGVAVIAYYITNNGYNTRFQADFTVGHVNYHINFFDNIEVGKAWLTEFVNQIILAEPADLSVLEGLELNIMNDPDKLIILSLPPPDMLTFNTAGSAMAASLLIPDGYFDHDLTSRQINAVFPNLGLNLSAVAHYRSNASLWFVTAAEYALHGTTKHFTGTSISLAQKGSLPEVTYLIYGEAPIISYVHEIAVTAFTYGMNNEFHRATFVVNGIAYRVQTSDALALIYGDEPNAKWRLTDIVNTIISGKSADLTALDNPTIPELRNERLSLSDARLDLDFGAFLPQNVPSGFILDTANRVLNTRSNHLFMGWSNGLYSLRWMVMTPTEHDLRQVISVNDREKYDVSLYPIPWALSVPNEIHAYFQSPVFLANEMTLEIIQARTNTLDRGGRLNSAPSLQISQFNVLHEDVLIQISSTGISPEQIWEMLYNVIS